MAKKPKEDFVEPDVISEEPSAEAPPVPTTPGVSEAAKNAARVLAEDRARETPLLDSATAASLQKQVDWENDAKEFFRDEDHARHRREAMLAEMDKRDIAERKEQEKNRAEAKKREDAAASERLLADAAAKRAEAERLEAEAKALVS